MIMDSTIFRLAFVLEKCVKGMLSLYDAVLNFGFFGDRHTIRSLRTDVVTRLGRRDRLYVAIGTIE